jgi:hypothetical protein
MADFGAMKGCLPSLKWPKNGTGSASVHVMFASE